MLMSYLRKWYPEDTSITFIPVEEVGTSGEERHKHKGIVDERVAILGSNNRVKIIYPNKEQQDKEADYLERLRGYTGVPVLYEEGSKYNIIERVYPLPEGMYSKNVVCVFAHKLFKLIQALYENDILHSHFRYFTM